LPWGNSGRIAAGVFSAVTGIRSDCFAGIQRSAMQCGGREDGRAKTLRIVEERAGRSLLAAD
jgi:hypothetical protein